MKDIIATIVTIFGMAIVSTWAVMSFAPRVEAAPDVPDCEAINTAGAITVYRCEPDEGATYLINSLGFMLVED